MALMALLPTLLLYADMLMQHLLRLDEDEAAESFVELWQRPKTVSVFRLLHATYSTFSSFCKQEMEWLQKLPPIVAEPAPVASSSSIAPVDMSASQSFVAALAAQRYTWMTTPKERCALCQSPVSFTSRHEGHCAFGHHLPRCHRTLTLISSPLTTTCPCCHGSVIRGTGEDATCNICWAHMI